MLVKLDQGSQTQNNLRATFPGKKYQRTADRQKMALWAALDVENQLLGEMLSTF